MPNGNISDRVKKIHGVMLAEYDDVPQDINEFNEGLKDPERQKKVHQFMVERFDDVPTDLAAFSEGLGLKKKDTSKPSVPSSETSEDSSIWSVPDLFKAAKEGSDEMDVEVLKHKVDKAGKELESLSPTVGDTSGGMISAGSQNPEYSAKQSERDTLQTELEDKSYDLAVNNPDKYEVYFNTENYRPVVFEKGKAEEQIQGIALEELGRTKDEFRGISIEEIKGNPSLNFVLESKMKSQYISEADLDKHADAQGFRFDMSRGGHAWRAIGKSAISTVGSAVKGAGYALQNTGDKHFDYVQQMIDDAQSGRITEKEYNERWDAIGEDYEAEKERQTRSYNDAIAEMNTTGASREGVVDPNFETNEEMYSEDRRKKELREAYKLMGKEVPAYNEVVWHLDPEFNNQKRVIQQNLFAGIESKHNEFESYQKELQAKYSGGKDEEKVKALEVKQGEIWASKEKEFTAWYDTRFKELEKEAEGATTQEEIDALNESLKKEVSEREADMKGAYEKEANALVNEFNQSASQDYKSNASLYESEVAAKKKEVDAGIKELIDRTTEEGVSLVESFQKRSEDVSSFDEGNRLVDLGGAIEGVGDVFETNPQYKGEMFADIVPQALGSVLAMAATGSPYGAAAIGGFSNAAGLYEEALSFGATPDQAFKAGAFGLGTGLSEGVPFLRFYKHVRKANPQAVSKALSAAKKPKKSTLRHRAEQLGKQGTLEGGQELLQGIANNMTAKEIYDTTRELITNETWQEAGAGFIIGGAMSFAIKQQADSPEKTQALEQLKKFMAEQDAAKGEGMGGAVGSKLEPPQPQKVIKQPELPKVEEKGKETLKTKPDETIEPAIEEKPREEQSRLNRRVAKAKSDFNSATTIQDKVKTLINFLNNATISEASVSQEDMSWYEQSKAELEAEGYVFDGEIGREVSDGEIYDVENRRKSDQVPKGVRIIERVSKPKRLVNGKLTEAPSYDVIEGTGTTAAREVLAAEVESIEDSMTPQNIKETRPKLAAANKALQDYDAVNFTSPIQTEINSEGKLGLPTTTTTPTRPTIPPPPPPPPTIPTAEPKEEVVEPKAKEPVVEEAKGETEKVAPVEEEVAEEVLTFTTHNNEQVSGERLTDAINKVADDMVESANKIREGHYADHVTEKEKDEILAKDLEYAEQVRRGENLDNLTIAQRVNTELTGETPPLLPKSNKPTSPQGQVEPELPEGKEAVPQESETVEALKDVESTTNALQGVSEIKDEESAKKKGWKISYNDVTILGKEGIEIRIDDGHGNRDSESYKIEGTGYKREEIKKALTEWGIRRAAEIDSYKKSETYHQAKKDGSNPELVKAVEDLLTPKKQKDAKETTRQAEQASKQEGIDRSKKESVHLRDDGKDKKEAKEDTGVLKKKRTWDFDRVTKTREGAEKEGFMQDPLEHALREEGVSDTEMDEAKRQYWKVFLEGNLPKKLPNKKNKIADDMVRGEVRTKPIPKKVKKAPNTIEGKAKSLSGIVTKDELRPAMQGVYHDAKNKKLVATDAHALVVIPEKGVKGKSKIKRIKEGSEVDDKYPDYEAVIPKDNPIKIKVNAQELLDKAAGSERASQFMEDTRAGKVLMRIKVGDIDLFLDPSVASRVLDAMIQNGESEVTLELAAPDRALVIKGKNILGLVMPVMNADKNVPYNTVLEEDFTPEHEKGLLEQDLKRLQDRHESYVSKAKKEGESAFKDEYYSEKAQEVEKEIRSVEKDIAKLEKGKKQTKETDTPSKGVEEKPDKFSETKRKAQIAKDKFKDMFDTPLGAIHDPKRDAKKMYEFHVAMVDMARSAIKEGAKTVAEFAESIGRKVDDFTKRAFSDAQKIEKGETPVVEGQDFFKEQTFKREKGEVEKTLTTERAYKGDVRKGVKKELEKIGLHRDVEDQVDAEKKGKAFVESVGDELALEAVRAKDIEGGPAATVWSTVVQNVEKKLATEKDPVKIAELEKIEAELIDEWGRQLTKGGQFAKMMDRIYQTTDLGFNVNKKINEYKEANKGEIPPEVEARFRDLDRKLKDVNKKLQEAEKRADEAEAVGAVSGIQESIKREKKKGGKKIEKAAIALAEKIKKAKIHRPDVFSAATPASIVWDGAVDIIAQAVKVGGKGAQVLADGIKYIRESDWYKSQSKSKQDEAEKAFSDYWGEKEETAGDKIKIPKSLIRDLVERGISDIDELTQAVKEAMSSEYPNATDREIRDAITEYGKVSALNKGEIETLIRKLKRVGRALSGIEDAKKGKRPQRSGLQRDKLDAEERALQKELNALLKDIPKDEAALESEWKSALDGIKTRLKNSIEDLERRIETGEKPPSKKVTEYDAEAKALKAERDRLKEVVKELEGKPEMSDEERVKRAIQMAERSIEATEKRIKEGRIHPETRKPIPLTPELKAAKDKLKEVRDVLNEMRKEAGIPEAKRLAQAKKRAEARIEELKQRIRDKDFGKKEVTPIVDDSELIKLKGEKIRLQEEYDKELQKKKLQDRTRAQRIKDSLWDAWGLTRLLRATGEFSFVGIQGLINTIAHPIQAAKAFKQALRSFGSEKKTEAFLSHIKAQEWYPELKQSKLALTEVHAEMTAREELFYSDHANMIWNVLGSPLKMVSEKAHKRWKDASPFRAFERAAVGYLDAIRVQRWLDGKEMLEMQGITFQNNPKAYKEMADVINTFTGRASIGVAERFAHQLTKIIFSPRNWASTMKTATPYAFYHFGKMRAGADGMKPSVAQKMALADFSKFVGLTTTMVALAATYLNNDDDEETGVELNPTSSDFGKIKIGNTRIDPWGGRIQQVILTSRFISGSIKKGSGEVVPLGTPFKAPTRKDLLIQFATNKLAPSASMVNKYLSSRKGKDGGRVTPYGEPYSVGGELLENLYPIYWSTINELLKDDESSMDGLLIFYAFFGGGVNVYDEKEKKSKKPINIETPSKKGEGLFDRLSRKR